MPTVPTGKPLARICGEPLVVHTLRCALTALCFAPSGARAASRCATVSLGNGLRVSAHHYRVRPFLACTLEHCPEGCPDGRARSNKQTGTGGNASKPSGGEFTYVDARTHTCTRGPLRFCFPWCETPPHTRTRTPTRARAQTETHIHAGSHTCTHT